MSHDKSQGMKRFKENLKLHVRELTNRYLAQEGATREYLKRDPEGPQREREANRLHVAKEVERLEAIFFDQVMPYIWKMRERIPDVLEQNNLTACYFLFGKISQSWRAIFLLARNGFHYEVMELLRSIGESQDLIFFFMIRGKQNGDLKKWFEGEIVSNERARRAIQSYMNKNAGKAGAALPVRDMKTAIYGGLSKYAHVSYGALLELFDVYRRDFDFEQVAGFHYTRQSSLPYAYGAMKALIMTLKFFYQSVGDNDSYEQLDLLLRRVAPEMYDANNIEQLGKRISNWDAID